MRPSTQRRAVQHGTATQVVIVTRPLRLAAVGLGYWGPNLARNLDELPGAELVVIEGMGHNLPRALWPRLVDRIAAHIQRVEAGMTV